MGLDIGDRRIGVAMSDPQGILASPLTIINRADEPSDINAILAIVDQNQVGAVVVGLPLSLNGSLGPQAEKVQDFAHQLRRHTEVTVEFRDERLTTASAQRLMKMTGKDRRSRDDAMAAALILQGYLDEKLA
ncbi:MAG: Holliday junction resolvase RuvX [Chloroflexi bacterium]|nr:Holliday junction resolvase RuvX [Chloroflexota bacterium]